MNILRLYIIIYLIALLAGCESNNPVGNGKTHILDGFAYDLFSNAMKNATINLTGNGVNISTISNEWGYFSFKNLASGDYTVRISSNGYTAYPDSLRIMVNRDIHSGVTFLVDNTWKKSMTVILGKALFENGTPVPGLKILISRGIKTVKIDSAFTNADGIFYEIVSRGENIALSPKREGYSFSFIPESTKFQADKFIITSTFTVSVRDMQLHSISGGLLEIDGKPINGSVRLQDNYTSFYTSIIAKTNPDGKFCISGIKDGAYILHLPNSHIFPESAISVTVKGHDVVIPDCIGIYNGPTKFPVSGKVVNQNGEGIPGVTININVTNWAFDIWSGDRITRPDGTFAGEAFISKTQSTYTFKLVKTGCIIKPDSASIVISKIEGKREGDPFSVPPFTGYDYTINPPSDYFPLLSGLSRTYARTINAAAPSDFPVSISGSVVNNGYNYFQFSPSGPAGLALFRIEGNTVRAVYANKDVELLRFGVLPGTKWEVGKVSDTYPVTGAFLGLESATVPAGTWPDCLKYEVRTTYGETSNQTCTLWFAKGVGMVKSEKILVNYGTMMEKITDELK